MPRTRPPPRRAPTSPTPAKKSQLKIAVSEESAEENEELEQEAIPIEVENKMETEADVKDIASDLVSHGENLLFYLKRRINKNFNFRICRYRG